MALKPDDPLLKPFGEWLAQRLDNVDKQLLQAMSDTVGLGKWTVFEQPMKKHAPEFTRLSEGAFRLSRREQYEIAGNELCRLVKSGELSFPGVDFEKGIAKQPSH